MKTVKLLDRGQFKAKDILASIMKLAPKGIDIEQMRQRVNILNILEKSGDTLILEDAPYKFLENCVREFTFAVADTGLLEVIDALLTPEVQSG